MSATHDQNRTTATTTLYLAFELGWNSWGLAFSTAPAQPPRRVAIPAQNWRSCHGPPFEGLSEAENPSVEAPSSVLKPVRNQNSPKRSRLRESSWCEAPQKQGLRPAHREAPSLVFGKVHHSEGQMAPGDSFATSGPSTRTRPSPGLAAGLAPVTSPGGPRRPLPAPGAASRPGPFACTGAREVRENRGAGAGPPRFGRMGQ
jgi:hypothetical protein